MADVGRLLQAQDFESMEDANAFLQDLLESGSLAGIAAEISPERAVDRAQNLVYEALEAPTRRECVRLARKALEVSPDCADAYVLLAEETARNPTEAKELYQQGVEAGERALGAECFENDAGHFWGLLETRPYMRARMGLAGALWELDEHDAAIQHAWDLLRLNPGDNQGIRYILLEWLLAREDVSVEKLLKQYEDDGSAAWLYGRSLHLFRKRGATKASNAALRTALKENPYVPPYLLGARKLPKQLPEFVGWGDDNEAVAYAATSIGSWRRTPGALDWLALPVHGQPGGRTRTAR